MCLSSGPDVVPLFSRCLFKHYFLEKKYFLDEYSQANLVDVIGTSMIIHFKDFEELYANVL